MKQFTPPLSVFNANFPFLLKLGCSSFLGNCNFYDFKIGRPIRSVIILVINKSDSRFTVVRFCYHLYDYRPNWTPLSTITITYNKVQTQLLLSVSLHVIKMNSTEMAVKTGTMNRNHK